MAVLFQCKRTRSIGNPSYNRFYRIVEKKAPMRTKKLEINSFVWILVETNVNVFFYEFSFFNRIWRWLWAAIRFLLNKFSASNTQKSMSASIEKKKTHIETFTWHCRFLYGFYYSDDRKWANGHLICYNLRRMCTVPYTVQHWIETMLICWMKCLFVFGFEL